MAIPASGAISASMLATEFSSSQAPSGPNISLGGLGTELSTPITFGNQVLMAASFYGQSSFSGTSFTNIEAGNQSGEFAFEDSEQACAAAEEPSFTATRFHDGTGTYPVNGDKVYQTNSTSSPLQDGYYSFNAGRSNFSYEIINGNGTVSEKAVC